MRGVLIFLTVIFSAQLAAAQIDCQEGNCISGKGVCVFPSGARYEGQFREGKPHGEGTLFFSDGREYSGDWKNGYREGVGKMTFPNNDKYTGEFSGNLFNGRGIMAYGNSNRYEGQWEAGQPNGEGVFYFANGDRYEGQVKRGQCHGKGSMYYSDGSRYEGQWANNKRHGKGLLSFEDGEAISGQWEHGQYLTDWSKYAYSGDTSNLSNCNRIDCGNGLGKFTYSDGSLYVGEFRNGQPEGNGTVYYASGSRYEGSWKQHTPHGRGVMYYANSRIVGAIWDFGKPVKKLYVQGEAEGPAPIPVDHNEEVKIWAVVVGAAQYSHMPALRYTDDDAYQVYAFLKSPEGGALPDQQVKLLIDEDATKKNILNAMRTVFLRADQNDVILFYFSGHGLQGSFLPVDFDGYNNQLKHTEIKGLLEQSLAKHKLVLADACHSGSLLSMKTPNKFSLQQYYKAFEESNGGMALLMSSKGEEYSLEDGGLRSGIFSHFLVRGLKGEANRDDNPIINIQELFNYVHKNVRLYTGNIQTPTLTGDFDYRMPVAFIRGE